MAARARLAILAGAVALVAAGCGGDDGGEEGGASGATTTVSTAPETTAPPETTGGGQEEGQEIALQTEGEQFIPADLTMQAGTEYTINVSNSDLDGHTFTFEPANVDEQIPSSGSTSFTVTAPEETGEYSYFCRFHSGMGGTITVN